MIIPLESLLETTSVRSSRCPCKAPISQQIFEDIDETLVIHQFGIDVIDLAGFAALKGQKSLAEIENRLV
jgi:hypothetical protein